MKRNQVGGAVIAVLLFLSGAAVGALGHRYYVESVVSAKGPRDDSRQHYIAEMRTKLQLTAAQTTQLEAIMDETKAKYKAVHDSNHPVMVKIKTEHVERVKSILTPQQIPKYEQLVAEHERRAREMERRDR
jgi:Spy/CpxP family protein refolding chaperone